MISLIDTTNGKRLAVGTPPPPLVEMAYQDMLDAWCAYMDACDLCEIDQHAVSQAKMQGLVNVAHMADAEFYRVQEIYRRSLEECTCREDCCNVCDACSARIELEYGDEIPF